MRAKRLKPLLLPLFVCAALAIHAALFFLVFRPYEESRYHWFHGIIYVWLDRPLLFYFGSQILFYLLLAALRPRARLVRLRRAAVLIFFPLCPCVSFLANRMDAEPSLPAGLRRRVFSAAVPCGRRVRGCRKVLQKDRQPVLTNRKDSCILFGELNMPYQERLREQALRRPITCPLGKVPNPAVETER